MDKIPYFHEHKESNKTYSVDMITIKAAVNHERLSDICEYLNRRLSMTGGRSTVCTSPNRYHWFYTVPYGLVGSKAACTVRYEVGQNNCNGTIADRIKIVFNPNKVFCPDYNSEADKAKTDLATVYELIRDITVDNIDLAIDIPVERPCVTIMPFAKRTYTRYNGETTEADTDRVSIHNADDYTQYVGHHQSHGFVKVYNKQAECGLPSPVTRAEITIKPDELKADYRWTPIYVLDTAYQMELADLDQGTADDKLLAELILTKQVPSEYLARIHDRRKKKKIQALVLTGYKELDMDITASWFKAIIAEIQLYVNKDIVKDFTRHKFLSTRAEYRIYSRRKFASKFYKMETVNGKQSRYYVCDFTQEQLLHLSDDEFNDGVRYFLALEDMTEALEHYKPYSIACEPETPPVASTEPVDEFLPVDQDANPFDD